MHFIIRVYGRKALADGTYPQLVYSALLKLYFEEFVKETRKTYIRSRRDAMMPYLLSLTTQLPNKTGRLFEYYATFWDVEPNFDETQYWAFTTIPIDPFKITGTVRHSGDEIYGQYWEFGSDPSRNAYMFENPTWKTQFLKSYPNKKVKVSKVMPKRRKAAIPTSRKKAAKGKKKYARYSYELDKKFHSGMTPQTCLYECWDQGASLTYQKDAQIGISMSLRHIINSIIVDERLKNGNQYGAQISYAIDNEKDLGQNTILLSTELEPLGLGDI